MPRFDWTMELDRPDADLVREAALWAGAMYEDDDPRGQSPLDYGWQRFEAYDIRKIASAPDDWVAWMREEIAMWRADGYPDRYDDILNAPIREEVCLVEIDGLGYLWDGYHRTGGQVMKGLWTVPAIVGRPLPVLSPAMHF